MIYKVSNYLLNKLGIGHFEAEVVDNFAEFTPQDFIIVIMVTHS